MHLNYVESRRTSLKANVVMRTRIAQITQILYLSLADSAEIADIVLLMSRRKKGNKRKVYPLDGFIEVVDVFLKINFHHTSLTSMLDSSWRVNLVFHLIRRILKVNFQSSSDKSKMYSIKGDSDYSSDSWSYKKLIIGINYWSLLVIIVFPSLSRRRRSHPTPRQLFSHLSPLTSHLSPLTFNLYRFFGVNIQ